MQISILTWSSAPTGRQGMGGWAIGLMGLDVYFPAADGNTGYVTYPEMLAWSRWQLGWLTIRQVRCVTGDSATIVLNPVADPGDGIAIAAIPLSDTEVIAIESRRRIGSDVVPGGARSG